MDEDEEGEEKEEGEEVEEQLQLLGSGPEAAQTDKRQLFDTKILQYFDRQDIVQHHNHFSVQFSHTKAITASAAVGTENLELELGTKYYKPPNCTRTGLPPLGACFATASDKSLLHVHAPRTSCHTVSAL